ncbi:Transcriptional regulator, TetR family [Beijerinckiaceae bacterium RH AL1]|nr:Transcriptional regulator, TetR family [Beijerinckiaceae bacterium RH CH11]VVB46801.1 Transcriptional regulator, TetR family [Beijerinckiaceae bacterium RH AL8]VVC55520.1 Transcriptional regulator, TetR family [Beijerinckiaceae bacterium RH AL1]
MLAAETLPTRRRYEKRARADATSALRARILDALLAALQVDDYDLITLNALAESAGTTRQTIIRLFGGKDGVLAALFERFDTQVAARRFTAGDGDLAVLAHCVIDDLEKSGGLVLRLLRQESRVPIIAQRFAEARKQHLAILARELAPLLERLDPSEAETALLQARAVTDTLFWNVLRKDMKLDAAAAEATLLDLLRKIFAAAKPQPF